MMIEAVLITVIFAIATALIYREGYKRGYDKAWTHISREASKSELRIMQRRGQQRAEDTGLPRIEDPKP